jgi:hypothetical protein
MHRRQFDSGQRFKQNHIDVARSADSHRAVLKNAWFFLGCGNDFCRRFKGRRRRDH